MIPWETLDTATVPGSPQPLALLRRGGEYVIRTGAIALMSSTAHGSEEALAELACARIAARRRARVLVGGLGMGFTLAAALRALGPDAHAVVAELVPAVLEWNRGPLAHLAGAPLADPRAEAVVADVAACIAAPGAGWDAILLDVDNGPDGLTSAGNARLYSDAGLGAIVGALRPGGVLGVWSVAPDRAFAQRLGTAGFRVEERIVRARAGKGGRHVLWIAERPPARR